MRGEDLAQRLGLMVALCRRDAESVVEASDVAFLESQVEWDAFVEVARTHRVEGLVLATLERLKAARPNESGWPADARFAPLHLARRQAIGWDLEQARVLAWLEKHAIPAVVLKGSALRQEVYRESAERAVADLDLLFREEDMAGASACLEELGYSDPNSQEANRLYRAHHFHTKLDHPAGFAIELHWGLTPPGPKAQLDPSEVIAGSVPAQALGRAFLMPSPEHMVLHLASQLVEDAFGRFGRIVDVDRVVASSESFDWAAVRRGARRGRLQNVVGEMLAVAERALGTAVPEGFVESLEISPLSRVNLTALETEKWMLEKRAADYVAAGVVMRFWLESDAAARIDVLFKACGLRRDPMRLIHDALSDEEAPPSRSRAGLLLAIPKILAFQVLVWARAVRRGEGESR